MHFNLSIPFLYFFERITKSVDNVNLGGTVEKVSEGSGFYWQGNGYIVTNALGHLFGIGMPEDYGWEKWELETLPLIPQNFKLFPLKGYNHYIDVYNDMLKDKMEKGQNGIIRSKYLTVTLQAPDLETARGKFAAIDLELITAFKKIGSVITPLTSNDRVNLLKDIFKSVDDTIPELSEKDFKRQAERAYCCPDYFEFKKDYFMWNNKYARTMFIKDMPSSLKDDMLTEIANTNLDVMVTVNIAPVDP